MPFDTSDLLLVEVKGGNWRRFAWDGGVGVRLPLSEIPDGPDTGIISRGEEVGGLVGPGHDVYIGVGDLHSECCGARFTSYIPHLDGAV